MPSPSEETAAAAMAAFPGIRRDRSYSDVARVQFEQPRRASFSSSDNNRSIPPPDVTMANDCDGHDAIMAPLGNSKKTNSKKKHHHHRHNAGGQLRSKSLDLHRHRHHPITQKRKYPNVHKHSLRTHSPTSGGGGCHALSPTGLRATSMSSSSYSPKLRGNMWIRRTSGTAPSVPVLATLVPTPRGHRVGDAESPLMMTDDVPIRQVTDGSSSKKAPSPTSFDDDMLVFSSSQDHDISSSDAYHRKNGPPKIIFGASGKPIMPKSAFSSIGGGTTAMR